MNSFYQNPVAWLNSVKIYDNVEQMNFNKLRDEFLQRNDKIVFACTNDREDKIQYIVVTDKANVLVYVHIPSDDDQGYHRYHILQIYYHDKPLPDYAVKLFKTLIVAGKHDDMPKIHHSNRLIDMIDIILNIK